MQPSVSPEKTNWRIWAAVIAPCRSFVQSLGPDSLAVLYREHDTALRQRPVMTGEIDDRARARVMLDGGKLALHRLRRDLVCRQLRDSLSNAVHRIEDRGVPHVGGQIVFFLAGLDKGLLPRQRDVAVKRGGSDTAPSRLAPDLRLTR